MIDSHINVWSERFDPRHTAPSWLDDDIRSRTRTTSLAEIDDEMAAVGISGLVLVQTSNHLDHTDELLAAAAESTRPATVVGWLPIDHPSATADALERYRDAPGLVGVRHRIIDETNTGFLLEPAVSESLDLIAERSLVLDVLPWPTSVLGQVPRLARRHPTLTIVIDLMGWPDIASGSMQPWTDEMTAAAAQPNVYLKVGGFFRMADDLDNPMPWRPYTSTALEVFGPDRMMLASDWPAITMYGRSYRESVRSTLDAFADLTDAERSLVESLTAARIYRL